MHPHGTTAHVPSRGLAPAPRHEIAGAAFLAGYANPKTRADYAMHLREWFTFALDRELDPLAVQRVHVELWVRALEGRGLKPRTVALKLTAIRSFYRYCLDEEWIDRSPVDRIKGPTIERKSPRGALTRTQLFDLIAASESISPTAHALVMLLGFNGLRIGETCAANVEDIVTEAFSPVLLLPNRKGGKEGAAALSRPVEAALAASVDGRTSGPLFLNQAGNRLTRANAQAILDRAVKGVHGVKQRCTPHVLRHTWCTLAVDAGVNLARLQHDGSWADQRMVAYYSHTRHDPIAATTHLVAAHVLSAA